jgi:hypothetical protein
MLVRQAGEHLTESLQPYVRYATCHDPFDESWPTLTSLHLRTLVQACEYPTYQRYSSLLWQS